MLMTLVFGVLVPASVEPQGVPKRGTPDDVVRDYIRLYSRLTLDRWKKLFHPALTVIDPSPDGTIRVRSLEEFFLTQKKRFESGHQISERLENTRIDTGRRIARVTADFVFSEEGKERKGRLGLHLAEGQDGWRVVAIIFSYDAP